MESALEKIDAVKQKHLIILLDYDGTLTPIVLHPEEAKLSSSMRHTLQRLTHHFPVAIVSGRGLNNLKELVAIDGIYYIGSHGLEMSGPKGMQKEIPDLTIIDVLDKMQKKLEVNLKQFQGAQLERKKFSIALHYRNVSENQHEPFREQIKSMVKDQKELKCKYGKRILELLPNLDWDKGKAVLWLLDTLSMSQPFPLYIGDDLTDEDAFKVVNKKGMAILVGEKTQETKANYVLNDPEQVEQFLQKLIE